MITKALFAVSATLTLLMFNVADSFAQGKGSDPSKVGDNIKDIFSPNAKALWWVALAGGLLFMAFSRKASRVGGIAILLVAAGVAIYNPAGVASFMQSLADRVI